MKWMIGNYCQFKVYIEYNRKKLIEKTMKQRSLVAMLAFLFLLNSCPEKQRTTSLQISLEKDLEIGVYEGDENYMFGSIIDVEVDSQENIYVLDWKNKTVRKFDKNGKFLQDIGSAGQGPGEYSAILVDSCLDKHNRLYVLEMMKVHIFNENGRSIGSFIPDLYPHGIMVNKEGEILLVGDKKDKIFHVYDQEGKYFDSFGESFPIPEKLRKFYNFKERMYAYITHLTKEEKLIAFNPFKYEMDIYEGKKFIRKISRSAPHYKLPKLTKNEKGEEIYLSTFVRVLEANNHIFVWYGTEMKAYELGEERHIDIYDKKDYAFLGTSVIQEKGRPAVVRNNKIYFYDQDEEADFPRIIRYKIVYQ